ncbi:MAG: molybdopterin cofactor-binding domain-containing protein [Hyphomicrobiaceae bacterium]
MGKHERLSVSRRGLLKGMGAGALVVSVGSAVSLSFVKSVGEALAQGSKPPLHPAELDSYIAIGADGKVRAFFGKMDMGHGLHTAIGQIVAEEFDVPLQAVTVYMGDTRTSVNQGGASGSTGVWRGGFQMRHAAAEARRVLVEAAATKLGIAADQLTVSDGVVASKSDASKKVSYKELIGGRYFNHKMAWNKKWGNNLEALGSAKPKAPNDYKIVGKSFPREDVAPKVYSTERHVADHKVPGMVHGRMIRPGIAGSVPVKVDEGSIKGIAGAKVVWKEGFIGVVADTEWGAIKAAETLKVEWSKVKPPFPNYSDLFDHIRQAKVVKAHMQKQAGNVADAFAKAAKTVSAEYEWPFQSHASMGPAVAVVEIKDGRAMLWTGGQKPHFARDGVAAILGMKREQADAEWLVGPGCYGRNDAGDCAQDAAFLAQAVGKPVRLAYMRNDATAWDPKGPASVMRVRAAIDADDNVIGYEFIAKGFSRLEVASNESKTHDCLAGQLLGHPLKPTQAFNVPANSYQFDNMAMGWETIPALIERGSPLRTSHLRDPNGPELQFASESFTDEMALAVGMDPVQFRLKHAKAPRDIAVIKAAMEKAGWTPRVGPNKHAGSSNTLVGRGFGYAQRNGSIVAIVAEVEVDRRTGRVWARKFTVAHDCGQIINPTGLRQCIEGNIVQGISRALLEEVKFDNASVTSVDWNSYPILDIADMPEQIDIVLIDRPNVRPTGAGEPSIRPVAGALANAVFDATGVRIRRAPLSPERVKQALSSS